MEDKKKMSTGRAIAVTAAFAGGISVANRIGNKIFEGDKIRNPITAFGYLAMVVAGGFAAAKATDYTAEAIEHIVDAKKEKTVEEVTDIDIDEMDIDDEEVEGA